MLQNYLKLALRNLLRQRLYSLLNIMGLATGLCSGMLVLLWIADELRYDRFHTKLPQIYRVLQYRDQDGQIGNAITPTPGLLAPALQAEIPEIKAALRSSWTNEHLLHTGDKSSYERGLYAEPAFFEVFSFQALLGDPVAALRDPGSVVITARTAQKFFGSENPIGKILRHDNLRDLKVAAVIQNLPSNSTFRFDAVLPFSILEKTGASWIQEWGNSALPTYIELHQSADLAAVNHKLEHFMKSKRPQSDMQLFAFPFADWRLHNEFKGKQSIGGRIEKLRWMGILGLFILLIACINFMNLSTARSERRAKEVGLRKTLGAQRGLIAGQFLSEALLMSALATGFGLLLTQLALPFFNRFFEKSLRLDFSNWEHWSAVLLLGLLTGLISGLYPAFFMSKFQPVRTLKGKIGLSGIASGSIFRKGLVGFQFAISIALIAGTIVIFQQLRYAESRPLGYAADGLLEIPARGDMKEKFDVIKSELLQIPGILSVSANSEDFVQMNSSASSIQWPGKREDQDFGISQCWAGYDWATTAGLKLIEGRDFNTAHPSDSFACLLNQSAVRKMGLQAPVIGTRIQHGQEYEVIGVVEDFAFNDALAAPNPLVMYFNDAHPNHIFVRLQDQGQLPELMTKVEGAVKKHCPYQPFTGQFTRETFQQKFDDIRATGQLAKVFGGLAILISCLGLLGLSAFVVEQRRQEIGIRKVLGASATQLWLYLSRDFLKPVVAAFFIATPPCAWFLQKQLAQYEYHISLSWWMFALAGMAALCIALFSVSVQSVRAVLENPVRALRE